MEDPAITVAEVEIPTSMDAPSAALFTEMMDLGNLIDAETLGTPFVESHPANLLPWLNDQAYERKRLIVARIDGRVVGQAMLTWYTASGNDVAWIHGGVHPESRRRGAGTALIDHVESLARQLGRTVFQTETSHTVIANGERLPSPTGFGDVSAHDPGVRFLRKRGYDLEQISRISFLDLPIDPGRHAPLRHAAEAVAGPEYRILTWSGRTPEQWLTDVAMLNQRMTTDAPSGALDFDDGVWDEARLREIDDWVMQSSAIRLTAAAEHIPSGRLAGYNGLTVPADSRQPIEQGPTLVIREHRGHRLGILLKLANLDVVARDFPESPYIVTWNAEENRHMLDVNEALGFRAVGYQGSWKKTLV